MNAMTFCGPTHHGAIVIPGSYKLMVKPVGGA